MRNHRVVQRPYFLVKQIRLHRILFERVPVGASCVDQHRLSPIFQNNAVSLPYIKEKQPKITRMPCDKEQHRHKQTQASKPPGNPPRKCDNSGNHGKIDHQLYRLRVADDKLFRRGCLRNCAERFIKIQYHMTAKRGHSAGAHGQKTCGKNGSSGNHQCLHKRQNKKVQENTGERESISADHIYGKCERGDGQCFSGFPGQHRHQSADRKRRRKRKQKSCMVQIQRLSDQE